MEVLEVIRKKSRAAAYCRFSSSNQREESIDAQLRAIYKFMGDHDYTPVGDYIDMALTGTNTDRPNFQRMIEDAKKGLFDVVILLYQRSGAILMSMHHLLQLFWLQNQATLNSLNFL